MLIYRVVQIYCVDLVKNIPDASIQEDNENNALAESNVDFGCIREEPGTPVEPRPPPKEKRKNLQGACKYNLQGGHCKGLKLKKDVNLFIFTWNILCVLLQTNLQR